MPEAPPSAILPDWNAVTIVRPEAKLPGSTCVLCWESGSENVSAESCLLSDLEPAPAWAAATEPYDLTGYTTFPQQFRCE